MSVGTNFNNFENQNLNRTSERDFLGHTIKEDIPFLFKIPELTFKLKKFEKKTWPPPQSSNSAQLTPTSPFSVSPTKN